MYSFLIGERNNVQIINCYIEQKTRLLVVEQQNTEEREPRYVRLTGQQIQRMKQLLFKGDFHSQTRPKNYFRLDGDMVVICCREECQVVKFRLGELNKVYNYYERHKERIAKYDYQFKY